MNHRRRMDRGDASSEEEVLRIHQSCYRQPAFGPCGSWHVESRAAALAWALYHWITLKTISASSSGVLRGSSVGPKQSQPRHTNWPESFTTCWAQRRPTTRASFTSLKLTPSAVRNIGCASKLLNLDLRLSPQRTIDVPWESAIVYECVRG